MRTELTREEITQLRVITDKEIAWLEKVDGYKVEELQKRYYSILSKLERMIPIEDYISGDKS